MVGLLSDVRGEDHSGKAYFPQADSLEGAVYSGPALEPIWRDESDEEKYERQNMEGKCCVQNMPPGPL